MLTRRAALKTTTLAGIAFSACPQGFSIDSSHTQQTDTGHLTTSELAKRILADKSLDDVHAMALNLLRGGLNAGTGYQTTWIRDMNTFIPVALEVVPPQRFVTLSLHSANSRALPATSSTATSAIQQE